MVQVLYKLDYYYYIAIYSTLLLTLASRLQLFTDQFESSADAVMVSDIQWNCTQSLGADLL